MTDSPQKRILKRKNRCKGLITAVIIAAQLLTSSILFAEAPPATFTPAENWRIMITSTLPKPCRSRCIFMTLRNAELRQATTTVEGLSGEGRVMKSMKEFLFPTHLFLKLFWQNTDI